MTVNHKTPFVALDPWRGVYNALRAAVLAGEYEAGARLVERELAAQFGTSRGPVRTALWELERAGLVIQIPRRGTFVRSLDEHDVDEIFTLWEAMWSLAVRRAAERITPVQLAELQAFLNRIPDTDDAELLLEFGISFHREVFRIAQHGRALDIFESLVTQAQARVVMLLAAGQWEALGLGREAQEVCDALGRGDVDTAVETSVRWTRALARVLHGDPALAPGDAAAEEVGTG